MDSEHVWINVIFFLYACLCVTHQKTATLSFMWERSSARINPPTDWQAAMETLKHSCPLGSLVLSSCVQRECRLSFISPEQLGKLSALETINAKQHLCTLLYQVTHNQRHGGAMYSPDGELPGCKHPLRLEKYFLRLPSGCVRPGRKHRRAGLPDHRPYRQWVPLRCPRKHLLTPNPLMNF